MPLYHNDDQAMLKDSVAPFVAEQAPVSHLRKLRDGADATGFSRDLWAQFTEMGLPGMLVPEAHGGLGMGHMEAGIVLEEIGRNLTPSPFLATSVGAVAALAKAGGTQAGRWLPAIASGEAIVALAIDEGAKHRPDRIATTATRAGNGFRLRLQLEIAGLELRALALEALAIGLGGAERLALRQEEIAGEAVLDGHHVAHLAEAADALKKDHLHVLAPGFACVSIRIGWVAARGGAFSCSTRAARRISPRPGSGACSVRAASRPTSCVAPGASSSRSSRPWRFGKPQF